MTRLQERLPNSAVLFVRAHDEGLMELDTEEKLYSQLEQIGYLNPKGSKSTSWLSRSSRCQLLNSTLKFHQHLMPILRRQARAYLIQASTQLLSMVEKCMSRLLDECLDMSRDLTMTPRRIAYAEEQEKNIVDQFRQISQFDTEAIIIEAIARTKFELSEKGLETYNTIIERYSTTPNKSNFDSMIQEIDQLTLSLIVKHSHNEISKKIKIPESGPLTRCLKQLEEAVECLEDESPSTYLQSLLAAGNNQYYRPIDALPTNSAIKRKIKLMLQRNTNIDQDWISDHVQSFLQSICPKKLGSSFHKFIKSESLSTMSHPNVLF